MRKDKTLTHFHWKYWPNFYLRSSDSICSEFHQNWLKSESYVDNKQPTPATRTHTKRHTDIPIQTASVAASANEIANVVLTASTRVGRKNASAKRRTVDIYACVSFCVLTLLQVINARTTHRLSIVYLTYLNRFVLCSCQWQLL